MKENGVEVTKVRFVVGKTANQRPYTISSCKLSPEAQMFVEDTMKETEPTGWLLTKISGTMLCTALLRADPRLEQRSMRRGGSDIGILSRGAALILVFCRGERL